MATELGRLRGATQDSADKKDQVTDEQSGGERSNFNHVLVLKLRLILPIFQLMSQIRILQGRLEKVNKI